VDSRERLAHADGQWIGRAIQFCIPNTLAERVDRTTTKQLGEIQLSTKHQLQLLDVIEALLRTFCDEVSIL